MQTRSQAMTEAMGSEDLVVLPESDGAACPIDVMDHDAIEADGAPASDRLQFWESEHTRPGFQSGNQEAPELVAAAKNYLGECMRHPYLPVSQIRAQQFARIRELVELAYRDIPVYRAKYQAAG